MFDWYREWGRCERNTTECCNQCVQRRNIYCAVRGTSRQVPERYCEDVTPARETYLTTQDCEESECVQDCITGEWSQWSFCSKTCGNLGFEMRRRSVLQGPVRGRPCPVLIQTTTCRNVSILPVCPGPNTTDPPISIVYTWRLGWWSACRNFSASDTGDGSVDCGLGLRQRIVNCVATNGSLVDEINCKSSPKEPTPSNVQACNLPCDCQVSSWSEWGNCSIACIANRTLLQLISGSGSGNGSDSAVPDPDEPHRLRMRTVLRSPKFGGEGCPIFKSPGHVTWINYLTALTINGLLVFFKPVKLNHLMLSVDLANEHVQLFVQKDSVILVDSLIPTCPQSLMGFVLVI